MSKINQQDQRQRRHRRVRAKVFGTTERPRLSIFKSNTAIYAQIINDEKALTIASASSLKIKGKKMMEKAKEVGGMIAKAGKEKGVSKVVFDRGGYIYTGKVKTFADSAREGGLIF